MDALLKRLIGVCEYGTSAYNLLREGNLRTQVELHSSKLLEVIY